MARLRNRMLKAEFWTDPDLLSWPRDKRFFYMGLRSLAEDSGCCEDSPFGWVLVLYPSPHDRDITEETLAGWRDELIADGKLIRYEVDGKSYLYQTTFHQHEQPRNPQRPDLPLPPWLRIDVKEGVSKDGKRWVRCVYEVSTDAMPRQNGDATNSVQTPYRDSTDSVQTPYTVPSPVQSSPVQSSPYPSDNAREADPVEKPIPSPTPPPEGSKRKARKPKTPTTCDGGEPCPTLMVKGVRQGIANIDPLHSGQLWQPETDLGGRMAELAAYICESAQDILPALEREQREKACQRMLKRAVERMSAAHAKEPIRNLPAYIVGLLKRQCLGDVIGDDLVEDLRREASASYGKRDGEPVAIGAALAGRLAGRTA